MSWGVDWLAARGFVEGGYEIKRVTGIGWP